jgi:hypothetical protein
LQRDFYHAGLKIEAKAIAFSPRFLEPIQVLHNSFGISFPSINFLPHLFLEKYNSKYISDAEHDTKNIIATCKNTYKQQGKQINL